MARTGGTTRRMVPAASWSPEDYYIASRAARAAWDKQDHQLSILSDSPALAMMGVLEAADSGTTSSGGVGSLERVPQADLPVQGDALDTTREEAC